MNTIDFTPDKSNPFGIIGIDDKNFYMRCPFAFGEDEPPVLIGMRCDPEAQNRVRAIVNMSMPNI